MIRDLMSIAVIILLLANLLKDDSEQENTDYKILKKDAKTEVRLYEIGEKYRCTQIENK